ncbi:DUF4301 family protein [Arenibacter sp. GZD96]|uniref:DUF4301 family protein n=1 Tax=Aurantibrevibacter litoralis TaxID=3106030 RepID=UPI002AFE66C0|nr:DUF4301 family protein [Arenibacter sp. GZD-96]MEA1785648.1 DUF4301 family protein [Arenibacter sp. GZD-96]
MEEKFRQQESDIIKVVLFGPESTGKTTLSEQLARHYNTVWVPEYAREYLQQKWNNERKTCEPSDLLPIAEGQMFLENTLTKKATNVLICDTDLLETKVYSEAYYLGYCDTKLEKYALENTYDLYFLTYIDVPWEKDDLRDKPTERQRMFNYFKETLERYNRNFVILKGDKKERLTTAVQHINKLVYRMTEFSEKDLEQLANHGITTKKVLTQIGTFKSGIPYVHLARPAKVKDGILKFSELEEKELIRSFEDAMEDLSLLKFVPASGAASRMFKALFTFLESYNPTNETLVDYLERTHNNELKRFFEQRTKLAFYKEVLHRIQGRASTQDEEAYYFVQEMLSDTGLNYGFYPKGLLPFHDYGSYTATPFEEHLKEGSAYAAVHGEAHLHFTISEQHETMFKTTYKAINERVSKATKTIFHVGYSYQKKATDTIAVDMSNIPFRDQEGALVFRPGGHGALIENLNEQEADIIFIKNIDNVVVPRNAEEVVRSKKILAGLLVKVQQQAFDFARKLDGEELSISELTEIKYFLEATLNVRFSNNFTDKSFEEQIALLKDKINRPIRICGMVKNEGEPGGGPFWIVDGNGHHSLQIVESAQIDSTQEKQSEIFNDSTHFNPVDLVCGVRKYKGEKFDLLKYVDHAQGFITQKTQEGKDLKALELPGLWNGAMAFWNTIFVEVPLVTFNPVKTVNDLLKPTHQVTQHAQ